MKKLIALILITIFSCTKEQNKKEESKYVVVNVYDLNNRIMVSDTTIIK